jgi:hypothetical protein
VLHLRLIILSVGDDVPIDSEIFFVTDFVNLNIKSTQSFRCAHRGQMCAYIHKSDYSYVYMYLRLYCVSKKYLIKVFHT